MRKKARPMNVSAMVYKDVWGGFHRPKPRMHKAKKLQWQAHRDASCLHQANTPHSTGRLVRTFCDVGVLGLLLLI